MRVCDILSITIFDNEKWHQMIYKATSEEILHTHMNLYAHKLFGRSVSRNYSKAQNISILTYSDHQPIQLYSENSLLLLTQR